MTTDAPMFPGIFIAPAGDDLQDTLSAMDAAMQKWTMRAARGECTWVCADCCCTFPDGMPDACVHGIQGCTDIITRDKTDALKDTP